MKFLDWLLHLFSSDNPSYVPRQPDDYLRKHLIFGNVIIIFFPERVKDFSDFFFLGPRELCQFDDGLTGWSFKEEYTVSLDLGGGRDLRIIHCNCPFFTEQKRKCRQVSWSLPGHWMGWKDQRHGASWPLGCSDSCYFIFQIVDCIFLPCFWTVLRVALGRLSSPCFFTCSQE